MKELFPLTSAYIFSLLIYQEPFRENFSCVIFSILEARTCLESIMLLLVRFKGKAFGKDIIGYLLNYTFISFNFSW